MPEFDLRGLPYLTRKMFAFEAGATFGLVVQSRGSTSGTITIRGATREGGFVLVHTPNFDNTVATQTFNLPDTPIWITVLDDSNSYLSGQLHVRINLAINGDIVHMLCAGYVYGSVGITWPATNIFSPASGNGYLNGEASADPAAGAELTYTVPDNQIWRVRAIKFTLVAAAQAASRRVHLVITPAGGPAIDCMATTDQTISQTRTYHAWPGCNGGPTDNAGIIMVPIPDELMLRGGSTIETVTLNLDAADNFGAMEIYAEEWQL